MKRDVINTETYQPERTRFGALCIIDTLSCGHEVRNKGSAGFAEHRECRECQSWADGHTTFKSIGDMEEKWDPENQMPYWVKLKKRR